MLARFSAFVVVAYTTLRPSLETTHDSTPVSIDTSPPTPDGADATRPLAFAITTATPFGSIANCASTFVANVICCPLAGTKVETVAG